MQNLRIWAQPWWVNLSILVPVFFYSMARKRDLRVTERQLSLMGIFAVAFGFVEAAVVVYLRAAIGLLPGAMGTLADLQHSSLAYQQALSIARFPRGLLTIEIFREAATLIMLGSVAFLVSNRTLERFAAFLWMFAFWDLTYYAGLWAMVRWPASLLDLDVLFLIPVPWLAQVWFPILVSALTLLAVILCRLRSAP